MEQTQNIPYHVLTQPVSAMPTYARQEALFQAGARFPRLFSRRILREQKHLFDVFPISLEVHHIEVEFVIVFLMVIIKGDL